MRKAAFSQTSNKSIKIKIRVESNRKTSGSSRFDLEILGERSMSITVQYRTYRDQGTQYTDTKYRIRYKIPYAVLHSMLCATHQRGRI